MAMQIWLWWLLGAFACGSIPFAVLIGMAKGVDIRAVGSGNPGASNLGRTIGKRWGMLCFVLDVGKGMLPVLLFGLTPLIHEIGVLLREHYGTDLPFLIHIIDKPKWYSDIPIEASWLACQWVFIAIAAVLGHVFSPWLKFKGGKGVATGLGASLGLFPIVTVPGVLAFAIWYLVCKLTGYVGLASIIAAASLPITTIISGIVLGLSAGETAVFAGLTALLAALVIYRHRGNLARLRAGTERKAAWTGKQ